MCATITFGFEFTNISICTQEVLLHFSTVLYNTRAAHTRAAHTRAAHTRAAHNCCTLIHNTGYVSGQSGSSETDDAGRV